MSLPKTLIYTVACDTAGESTYRNLAKVLVASLLRVGFEGKIVVFHNRDEPLFHVAPAGVEELAIVLDEPEREPGAREVAMSVIEERWSLKHETGRLLLEEHEWDRLLFLDADCVVTRPLAPLLAGDWDILVCREPGQPVASVQFNSYLTGSELETPPCEGVNSGIFGVSRSLAGELFARWAAAERLTPQRRLCCRDQAAFNRVLLDHGHEWRQADVSSHVSMPYHTDGNKQTAGGRIVTHWVGAEAGQKLQSSFGLFMETFYYDPALTFFNLLNP